MTTFIFAGGGSGGHIFPALAIHEELALADPASKSVFACSDRPLDREILSRAGVTFRIIPAKPMSRRVRGLYRFLRSWGPSVRAGRALIREAVGRGERVQVVAMGGFVAAPIAQAARAEGVPVLLVNLDAIPGKANRMIARRCQRVVSSVPVIGPSNDWAVLRPIVRRSAMTTTMPAECRQAFGLDPGRRTLLVTGGSQGAVSINRTVLAALREHPAAFKGWQVIHQTGRGEVDAVRAEYRSAGVPAVVRDFFDRMGDAWRAADLAVSRAGAGGVAEAWAYHVPTLFLPNPYHKDQHQRHNAQRLVDSGGACIAADRPDGQSPEAVQRLIDLMTSTETLAAMRLKLEQLGPADGAAQISRLLIR